MLLTRFRADLYSGGLDVLNIKNVHRAVLVNRPGGAGSLIAILQDDVELEILLF